jgi:hypothetical protein
MRSLDETVQLARNGGAISTDPESLELRLRSYSAKRGISLHRLRVGGATINKLQCEARDQPPPTPRRWSCD